MEKEKEKKEKKKTKQNKKERVINVFPPSPPIPRKRRVEMIEQQQIDITEIVWKLNDKNILVCVHEIKNSIYSFFFFGDNLQQSLFSENNASSEYSFTAHHPNGLLEIIET